MESAPLLYFSFILGLYFPCTVLKSLKFYENNNEIVLPFDNTIPNTFHVLSARFHNEHVIFLLSSINIRLLVFGLIVFIHCVYSKFNKCKKTPKNTHLKFTMIC